MTNKLFLSPGELAPHSGYPAEKLFQPSVPEPIPIHQQAANFALVHGFASGVCLGSTCIGDREELIKALSAVQGYWPGFQDMAAIDPGYGEKSSFLLLSDPYPSKIKHELVGFSEPHSDTYWATLGAEQNPNHIMRIWRRNTDDFPKGETHSRGLYVAQPKSGGRLRYFAVTQQSPGKRDLRVLHPLDRRIATLVMEEVALAAEAILNNEAHHIPDTEQHGWKAAHIQDTLDGYPHPRSDLLPVFSANQVGATALMRVEVPTIERGTVEQAIADVPIVNEIL